MTQLTPFRRRRADQLSGGMRQKLALACTLVHEPAVLLLDEPTTGVDPVSRREFWKLLGEFLREGRTIVLATPYLDEAERCTRVALVSEGKLLALDEPSRLQHEAAGRIVEVVVDEPRAALTGLRSSLGRHRVQLFGDRLHVGLGPGDTPEAIGAALEAAGHVPFSVRPIVPSLEDVFIAKLGSAPRDHAASHERRRAGDHP
jgi:ABC-2 type transport system ATP-binding protein